MGVQGSSVWVPEISGSGGKGVTRDCGEVEEEVRGEGNGVGRRFLVGICLKGGGAGGGEMGSEVTGGDGVCGVKEKLFRAIWIVPGL